MEIRLSFISGVSLGVVVLVCNVAVTFVDGANVTARQVPQDRSLSNLCLRRILLQFSALVV